MSAKRRRNKGHKGQKYAQDLETFIERYIAETGDQQWTRMKVAAWAIDNGLWHQRRISAVRQLAAELANVMRRATFTNEEGHEIRKYHAYRLGDDQPWMWKEMSKMATPEMRESATSRRDKLAGGVIKLTLDTEHFDKHFNAGDPIVIDPDFTKDVAEYRQASWYDDQPPDDGNEKDGNDDKGKRPKK